MTDTHIREIEDPVAKGAAAKPDKAEKKEDWRSFAWFCLKLLIVVLLFRSFAFTSFNIPSESMMPRLLVGDYMFAKKWPYGYTRYSMPLDADIIPGGRIFARQPERGDIVIFAHPIDHSDYIKRVIGLPGDTIQMIDGVLHINGTPVKMERIEDFVIPDAADTGCRMERFRQQQADGSALCVYPQFRETLPNGVVHNILDFGNGPGDNTAPVVVPEDRLFMMGDNRDNSLDSRFPAQAGGAIGLVPQENLVAQAGFMYWSTDGSAGWLLPWTWFSAARWSRIGRGI